MPESKRYAESDAERTEILDRHHAVLGALGAEATEDVICIVARWGSSESAIDDDPDLEQAHPGAWLWTSGTTGR